MLRFEEILSRLLLKIGVSSCSTKGPVCPVTFWWFVKFWFKSRLDTWWLANVCDSVKIASLALTIDVLLKLTELRFWITTWLLTSSSDSARFKRCYSGFTLFKGLKQQLSSVFSESGLCSCFTVTCGRFYYAAPKLAATTNIISIT